MDMDGQTPWPTTGDTIFAHSPDWHTDAQIESSAGDWYAYTLGYRRAGDLLVQQIDQAPSHQELLVYPILFLYRHYLELQMKHITAEGRSLLDKGYSFPTGHSLNALWSVCCPILEQVFPESTPDDTLVVAQLIAEFHSIDPQSITFRYPTDKNGAISVPPGLRRINLTNLSSIMAKLEAFFGGAATGISVYFDTKHEMEAFLGP